MSSIAGPSTHAFSSFPAHPRQPPAISTKLHRIQDAPDSAAAPSSTTTQDTPVPATPVLTTAPTTAPATPVVRSNSQATDLREASQDPTGSVAASSVQNGTTGRAGMPPPSAWTPRGSVAADLDAVNSRTIALSKGHKRGADEEAVMVQTAARIASRLAEDHHAALFPDVDEPFADDVDVVKRLLPYHVFQLPREDLEMLGHQNGTAHPSRKGKRKATEEDLLREEIADTKFAIECWKRRRALEQRFKKARNESGKNASPSDQGYVIAQAVLEVDRAENAALTSELRSARAELDKLEREKRAAAAPSAPAASTPARPTPTVRTASASSYYSPSTTTPTTATFMPPYRPPYSAYSQYPTTQYTYNPYAYSSYTPTTSTAYGTAPQTPASTTSTTGSAYFPPATASMATPTSAASAQVQQAAQAAGVSNTAIPVQLPVSSLPALAALGIIPIAAASVPPAGQPQPPAVIKSTNGTALSLEINLSLLQSAQMSGLVLILNALTSRGVNVDGSSAFQAGSAAPLAAPSAVTQSSNGVATASLTGSKGSSAASTTSNTPAPSTSVSSTASTPAPPAGS